MLCYISPSWDTQETGYVWKPSRWISKKKKKLNCILFPFFNKKKKRTKVLVLILRKCLKYFNTDSELYSKGITA